MPSGAPMRIVEADARPETLAVVRELFTEYAHQLGHDLCFQDFDQELATLPGQYAPPQGAILLAARGALADAGACDPFEPDRVSDPLAAGCVALRPIGDPAERCAEMKRLWVRAPWRRTGLGRRLAEAIVERARQLGYARVRLDTLASMTPAIALYRSLGFREIPPYYPNPLPDVLYFELTLWPN
jgi:ribosomal protein S18 acetylase RimI-like enzyme